MTRIGSLFSGYGGLDIAVQRVLGGEVAWYSEIEPAACAVLAAHHPGVPNLGDITAVDWTTVPPVDVLTGGYPCQPFSHAGKRQGANDERHLWPYVRDAIGALGPRLVVLENVAGHLTLGLADVLADLAEVGYDARWGVVRAADAGAPHGRARVFIVAHPHGSGRHEDVQQPGDLGASAHEWQPGVADGHRADGPAADADSDGHGSQLHAAGVGGVEGEAAGGAPERQRARGVSNAGGDQPAADAEGGRRGAGQGPAEAAGGHGQPGAGDSGINWGRYAAAIHRWERVLGRRAPAPTVPGVNGRPRLSPAFVEWMMGLDPGHVTGHGLRPAQCLKMLGNGVVPQQGEMALRMLLGVPVVGVAGEAALLPTPRAQNGEERNQNIWARPAGQPQNLENALALLPTPRAAEADHAGRVTVNHAGQVGLAEAVNALLPTPRTSDTNGAGRHGSGGPDLRTVVAEVLTDA